MKKTGPCFYFISLTARSVIPKTTTGGAVALTVWHIDKVKSGWWAASSKLLQRVDISKVRWANWITCMTDEFVSGKKTAK